MANEVRLVDANALIEDITAAEENAGMGAVVAGTLRRYVNRRPTIDPESLRPKGRWVEIRGMAPPEYHGKHMCSLCFARALERKYHEELSDYCPNCGADMKEG